MNFDTSKTWQDTDVPSKVTKENADIFAEFLDSSFNDSVKNSNITPVLKKQKMNEKIIMDQSAFCQTYQKYLKDLCSAKY